MRQEGYHFDRTQLNDGLITGCVMETRNRCEACGAITLGIRIDKIMLPEGFKPSLSIILYRWQDGPNGGYVLPIKYIGITCGCYARAHRQVAYIKHQRKARRTR